MIDYFWKKKLYLSQLILAHLYFDDLMDSTQFGSAVRGARKSAALTQAEAAALCGVSTPFLSHLENGKPTAQLGKALHVAIQLGLRFALSSQQQPSSLSAQLAGDDKTSPPPIGG